VKVMMLISTVVGGLFIYVIFERFLKKALHRAQDQRKAIEIGTLIAAIIAVGLATASLAYTLSVIDALEERVTALEKAGRS
jgi:fumarate reductase subunit D